MPSEGFNGTNNCSTVCNFATFFTEIGVSSRTLEYSNIFSYVEG